MGGCPLQRLNKLLKIGALSGHMNCRTMFWIQYYCGNSVLRRLKISSVDEIGANSLKKRSFTSFVVNDTTLDSANSLPLMSFLTTDRMQNL